MVLRAVNREGVPYIGEVECPRDVAVAFVEQEPRSRPR